MLVSPSPYPDIAGQPRTLSAHVRIGVAHHPDRTGHTPKGVCGLSGVTRGSRPLWGAI